MKIQCPKCKTVYEIVESKLPEKGARVTCKKCQNPFIVKREEKVQEGQVQKGEVQEDEAKEVIITCPECGHVNISEKTCVSCGKAFSEEEIAELQIEI